MIELGVNIDHVATVRQARGTLFPDPVEAAIAAIDAGADLITLHLREDRRHIQDNDLTRMRAAISNRVNLEMAATEEMVNIAIREKPDDVCLVPEHRQELTTEGGLNVAAQRDVISLVCQRLALAGIRVSLFIDPDPTQVLASAEVGAEAIEIHTGQFAETPLGDQRKVELDRIHGAVQAGLEHGLRVNAGHGLNYDNVQEVASIEGISELNIGHSIIAQSLFTGIHSAVGEMKRLMLESMPD
ncbi:MAG: pyridoxine 5'-phosphate synthase [Acidiferrobacteraceae bacterium]|nr:pyridoxine 5'-phosphate synthase [Acidiferrobacteraceae bacterium]MDP6123139.1 pyridoxine 5'-phosphate synthase [Arenicellales bacterium]MDP6435540.1 pyridoxine 5'-phosphate synthase [Arenicellales bacterium]MDP6672239.1 pyridoxine 5'-phosphate synthase [Arenicellales bacterium]MDP6723785.1 pyridoxine 5'-phosphate synthase [Arenicellales bacterium]